MLKIATTGPDGLVGSRIIELLSNDFEFIPFPQSQMNITDKNSVKQALENTEYDLLLHLAAYTNVNKAEKEKELAHKINVEGTKNLFEVNVDKKMIYISTDFVFDGQNPPFFEDSIPNPFGYYGQTKYEGEKVVLDHAMIVRISYPYRKNYERKKDLVATLKDLLAQGKELTMVKDSSITPTFIDDIAYALKYLINNYAPEIFHVVGANSLSPYEAGRAIADAFQFDASLIKPTSFEEYFKGKIPRPRYSEIKSKKNSFCKMKTFEEGLLAMTKD